LSSTAIASILLHGTRFIQNLTAATTCCISSDWGKRKKKTVRKSLTRRMHITKTNTTRIGRRGDARVSNAKVSDTRVDWLPEC